MAEKLLQHKHCRNCGRAVNVKDDFCNEKCESEHREFLRKKRNQLYMMMALAIGLMVLTLLLGSGGA